MIDYNRLQYLNNRIKKGLATNSEKDEYMNLLYDNGSITKNQYDKYFSNRSADNILSTAITIGGIILLGYLISEIEKNNQK